MSKEFNTLLELIFGPVAITHSCSLDSTRPDPFLNFSSSETGSKTLRIFVNFGVFWRHRHRKISFPINHCSESCGLARPRAKVKAASSPLGLSCRIRLSSVQLNLASVLN
ncbi:hypothetical protein EPI10_002952 [Gossypium australe]|uniref:Uncharacterized protein n=1 Tax=Gossypium australe TaxID=47621 RepID=A0A5B6VFX6_9ROSI|nr:hypothetical protein EPI10_002952 [Gossypium australe]